jgi:hypothetical protein
MVGLQSAVGYDADQASRHTYPYLIALHDMRSGFKSRFTLLMLMPYLSTSSPFVAPARRSAISSRMLCSPRRSANLHRRTRAAGQGDVPSAASPSIAALQLRLLVVGIHLDALLVEACTLTWLVRS